MDIDKDGTITKNDIRAAFDNVGKLMSEGELDDMLSEVGGPCTFDAMIQMFQTKMAGGKIYNLILGNIELWIIISKTFKDDSILFHTFS